MQDREQLGQSSHRQAGQQAVGVNERAGDSIFQGTWTTAFQSPARPKQGFGTLTFGLYRMALPLAGLRCCRTARSGRGLWPAGTGDCAASRWSSCKSWCWKGRCRGRGQFAPNFGCLLGWLTGLQRASGRVSSDGSAGRTSTTIK